MQILLYFGKYHVLLDYADPSLCVHHRLSHFDHSLQKKDPVFKLVRVHAGVLTSNCPVLHGWLCRYGSFYGCAFRAWPETFYSGALTAEQTQGIVEQGTGLTACESGKFLSLGVPSGGGGRIFVHTPQGYPFGLLVHDMVERFLLHFFTHSAHGTGFICFFNDFYVFFFSWLVGFRPHGCTPDSWALAVSFETNAKSVSLRLLLFLNKAPVF